MENSTYNPEHISHIEKSKVSLNGIGVYGESEVTDITIPVETHIDLTLTDDMLLTGGTLLVKGGNLEDKVSMQVIHPTLGIVKEFVTNYRIIEDSIKQFEMASAYPAKIPANLTLRLKSA